MKTLRINESLFQSISMNSVKPIYKQHLTHVVERMVEILGIRDISVDDDGRCNIDLKGPLFIDLGNVESEIPEKLMRIMPEAESVERILNRLQLELKSANVVSWNEFSSLAFEKAGYKPFIDYIHDSWLLDNIYEVIAAKADDYMFGTGSKLEALEEMAEAYENLPKSIEEGLKIFKEKMYEFEIRAENGYSIEVENLDESCSILDIIQRCYFEIVKFNLDKPEDYLEMFDPEYKAVLKFRSKKDNKQIGKEYLKLYAQMLFVYFAEVVEFNDSKDTDGTVFFIPALISKENINEADKNFVLKAQLSFGKNFGVNFNKDIKEKRVLNPAKAVMYGEKGKNFTKKVHHLNQKFLVGYYAACLNMFKERFHELRIADYEQLNGNQKDSRFVAGGKAKTVVDLQDKIDAFLMETFRIGYLLRNSMIFGAYQNHLLKTLYKTKKLEVSNRNQSWYSSTLALCLERSDVDYLERGIEGEALKAFDEYETMGICVGDTSDALGVIRNLAIKFVREARLCEGEFPSYLLKEMQSFFEELLKDNDDKAWKELERMIIDYNNDQH